MGHYRIAHPITMNPSIIYVYTYQNFCHKFVFLANQLISWECSKELYGQKLENHKYDSDLFTLQFNHSIKLLGELITTKVIGLSTAACLNAGWPFTTSKKHMSETNNYFSC